MAKVNEYDVGDLVRVDGEFRISGTLTDPSTLTVWLKRPNGTVITYVYGTDVQLIRDSQGKFHFDESVTLSGKYTYKWKSTGTAQAAEEGIFYVKTPSF